MLKVILNRLKPQADDILAEKRLGLQLECKEKVNVLFRKHVIMFELTIPRGLYRHGVSIISTVYWPCCHLYLT